MRLRSSFWTFLLGATLALATVSGARADTVPSSQFSDVDSCLVVCPSGDVLFHAVIRDQVGTPLPGSVVQLDLCGCPDVHLCPPLPGDPYTITGGCLISAVTNASGVVDIPIRGGGVSGCSWTVRADGFLMLTGITVRSPDQDGNG